MRMQVKTNGLCRKSILLRCTIKPISFTDPTIGVLFVEEEANDHLPKAKGKERKQEVQSGDSEFAAK